MPLDSFAIPDHLSGQKVFKYAGSAVSLGTNIQVGEVSFLSAQAQENDDARVIDLEVVRRRRQQLQEDEVQQLLQFPLLQMWYALAHSGISARNFGRLQTAASELVDRASSEAARTLYGATNLFLKFWDEVKQGNQEPELHVADSGRLQALWSHPNGWFLVIEFGSDDKVFWAVYQDADIVEGEQSSANIALLAQNLMALASKPLRWHC